MSDSESSQANWERFPGDSVRDRLQAALRSDLLGPGSSSELIEQSPSTKYLLGMLAPAGTTISVTEDEGIATADGEETDDAGVTAHTSLDPSAIGISFVVARTCEQVGVKLTWGEYSRETAAADAGEVDSETSPTSDGSDEGSEQVEASPKSGWRRSHRAEDALIPAAQTDGPVTIALGDGIDLTWRARKLGDDIVVSVFLSNNREAPEGARPSDELWIFQPTIEVISETPSIFGRGSARTVADPDADIASSDLLYRQSKEFATGHGVSAGWDEPEGTGSATKRIWTEVMPAVDVAAVTHGGSDEVEPPLIDELAVADAQALGGILQPVISAYGDWLEARELDVHEIPSPDDEVARRHLSLARKSLSRMQEGLDLLQSDSEALKAFQFANRAMANQMVQSAQVRFTRGRSLSGAAQGPPRWHMFQIGFILQCLPSLVDPDHDDRNVADLLWFPTGGGKTEAYLALTAFSLAHRRLRAARGEVGAHAGTAVIMRYTLRLLTTQQFQRALTMICACELMRCGDPATWGTELFSIGLWVGQSLTPNSFDDAAEALEKLKRDERLYKQNPFQVVYCPWCGHDMKPSDYRSDSDLQRTLILCPNEECSFSSGRSKLGLPVLLVDSEIYRHPPSLLLATVDKFASMPWNGRIQALFGRVSRHCDRHGFISAAEAKHPNSHNPTERHPEASVKDLVGPLQPPELIIQDELHLISGPLGTLVGIYEVAVDLLCKVGRQSRSGAKVIASTATIRRAERQVEALFSRGVEVFPPLGLNAEDSFFARKATSEEKPGRLYVGVYAPGRSVKTALVRVYAAILSRALAEFEDEQNDVADSYMTLVGYFNSIRELGGALRLVEDDVPARINVLRRRKFGPGRRLYESTELTSRVNSGEIPEMLKKLERQFQTRERGAFPVDVLLASNMLSVGVDIDRLGVMVVTGQPKTTAEYIQATSRVGRRHPGLVVTVYNWVRPRDTSHYETFRHYHETFYRHVEATSVTPFSARSRDRALAGVVASYVRLDTDDLVKEVHADEFDSSNESVKRLMAELSGRVQSATGRDDIRDETEKQVRALTLEWETLATDPAHMLVYTPSGKGGDSERKALLKSMENQGPNGQWPVSRSLREVEPEVDVVLRESPEGT